MVGDASDAVFCCGLYSKNHPDFDPITFILSDGGGSKYNYLTFDSDGTWIGFLQARSHTNTLHICMRNLTIYGLEAIEDIIDKCGEIRISDLIGNDELVN